MDYYEDVPRVHIVEGEGGMTPGRASEALAAAGTASLKNAILHVDWNQSSIDSNRVCREGDIPGDYVQWNPLELVYLHDWNAIFVPDGTDFEQIFAAQRAALTMDNSQPTAVVYRTEKGWQYGIEGKASHGAGHNLCVDGFYRALQPLLDRVGGTLPRCEAGHQRCGIGKDQGSRRGVFLGSPDDHTGGAAGESGDSGIFRPETPGGTRPPERSKPQAAPKGCAIRTRPYSIRQRRPKVPFPRN